MAGGGKGPLNVFCFYPSPWALRVVSCRLEEHTVPGASPSLRPWEGPAGMASRLSTARLAGSLLASLRTPLAGLGLSHSSKWLLSPSHHIPGPNGPPSRPESPGFWKGLRECGCLRRVPGARPAHFQSRVCKMPADSGLSACSWGTSRTDRPARKLGLPQLEGGGGVFKVQLGGDAGDPAVLESRGGSDC